MKTLFVVACLLSAGYVDLDPANAVARCWEVPRGDNRVWVCNRAVTSRKRDKCVSGEDAEYYIAR